ncbi:hypothetical protein EB796_018603 [Bugula neritina]|uniref:Uncharacterized protein n=1 Tax=Bugula neritina TaxID=10212 RepID=A0A7J7JAN0_BUGNE|nr:hypothetical protein EB796_018603 [Bugula neritina]
MVKSVLPHQSKINKHNKYSNIVIMQRIGTRLTQTFFIGEPWHSIQKIEAKGVVWGQLVQVMMFQMDDFPQSIPVLQRV